MLVPTPRFFASLLCTGALGLATSGVAPAGDRFTPPTFSSPDDDVHCRVVNISGAKHTVEVEVRDTFGNPVPNSACFPALNPFPAAILAGDGFMVACSGGGPRYCRFTVAGAASTTIRATMEVRDGTTQAVLTVIPAD